MLIWETRMTPRAPRPPRRDLIRTAWTVGDVHRVVHARVYQVAVGVELAIEGDTPKNIYRTSLFAMDNAQLDAAAAEWKQMLIDQGFVDTQQGVVDDPARHATGHGKS